MSAVLDAWTGYLASNLIPATALALLLLLLVKAGRRFSSPLRYGLLCLAVAKFVLPTALLPGYLILSVPVDIQGRLGALRPSWLEPAPPPLPTPTAPVDFGTLTAASLSVEAMSRTDLQRIAVAAPEGDSEPSERFGNGVPRLTASDALIGLQLLGSLAVLAWIALQFERLRRGMVGARPANGRLLAMYRREARRQGFRYPPELVVTETRLGPAAIGLIRRRVVLPAAVATRLSPAHLRPIFAHELAHHRRADLWVDLVLGAAAVAWWFNPVFWLLARALRRLREDCCDELVLATGRVSGSQYCQSLLDVARALNSHPQPALLNGSISHPLGRRITRMMNNSFAPVSGLGRPGLLALLLVGSLVLPAVRSRAGAEPLLPSASPAMAALSAEVEQSWLQRVFGNDWVARLDRDDLDRLEEHGLDRDFLEARRDAGDEEVDLAQLRAWAAFGVESELVDELEAFGIRGLWVSELFRLVLSDADAAYLRSLREIGYTDVDAGEIARLARYGVDARFIAEYREQGFDRLDVDELVRLRRYDVDPDYAGAMKNAGQEEVSVDELVRLHRYAVEPDFVAEFRGAGYDLSVDELVRLNRYEVEPGEVAELAAVGIDELEVDDLVRLHRYGIDAEFIRRMTEEGTVEISVDDLIRLSRYEVDPGYAAEIRDAGYEGLSTDELVRLKRYSVDVTMVRELAALGYTGVSVDDLVRLQRYAVDLAYVTALQQMGHDGLSVDELVKLNRYGVDVAAMQALVDVGYLGLSTDDVVRLQRYEVDAEYIREMGGSTSRRFNVDELVRLKRYGVDGTYVGALAAVGFGELEVDDMIRLSRYEVDADFIAKLQAAGFDDLDIDKIIRLKRAS